MNDSLAGMANALLVHYSGLKYREGIGRVPPEMIATPGDPPYLTNTLWRGNPY